jgi:hypothetical protein
MASSFLFQFFENYYYLVLNHFVCRFEPQQWKNDQIVLHGNKIDKLHFSAMHVFPKEILRNTKTFGGSGMLFMTISK